MTRFRLLVLAALALALALTPTAHAAKPREAAFDYTAIRGLTTPKHETERTVVRLPAYDGKELYIEVVKPKADGRWPVILESSPYHGTLADRDGRRILPEPRDADGKSIVLTGYFAPRAATPS
jgi:predicted acyl esterase